MMCRCGLKDYETHSDSQPVFVQQKIPFALRQALTYRFHATRVLWAQIATIFHVGGAQLRFARCIIIFDQVLNYG